MNTLKNIPFWMFLQMCAGICVQCLVCRDENRFSLAPVGQSSLALSGDPVFIQISAFDRNVAFQISGKAYLQV